MISLIKASPSLQKMNNLRKTNNRRRKTIDIEGARHPPLEVGVFCETDPLKRVSIWGLPGNEAYLAQFLPKNVSLFTSNFDVFKARQEYSRARSLLKLNGVELVEIKEVVADSLLERGRGKDFPQTKEDMIEALTQRAFSFNEKFRLRLTPNWRIIKKVLEEDISDLGLKRALILNGVLCLSEDLPMANVVFARDQTCVIGNHLVFSRMTWKIRQPEVDLYRLAYENLGLKDIYLLEKKSSFLEGGDVIVFQRTCYIGVGIRTTQEAALEIFEILHQAGDSEVENFVIVADPQQEKIRETARRTDNRPETECMHLDTFWMPTVDFTIVCCLEEARKRFARLIDFNQKGKAYVTQEIPFTDYLNELRVRIIDVAKNEQVNHGVNFLDLDERKVITSLSSNHSVLRDMKKIGIEIISGDISELTKAGGGIHCLTSALYRTSNENKRVERDVFVTR